MADRREVLELEPEDVLTEDVQEEQEPRDDEAEPEDREDEEEGDEPTETFIGFEGEEDEAAPASEGESSVIREMRRKLREKDRELADLRAGAAPAKIEVGDKPTLESCEYDEERFETALDAWKGRKAKAEQQDREQQERTEREQAEWSKRAQAYETSKASIPVADYADAEKEVFAALPDATQALILMTDKPAALIYALSRDPARLEELSNLNLARAAMMIGKLEDKVQVKKRALPNPDRPVRGNAAPASADKTLARLEKEAEETGDRTKLVAHRKKLRNRA